MSIARILSTALLLGTAGVAQAATTVDFAYNPGIATGEFTYADGATGILGYGDLLSFSVTVASVTYTLADVLPLTDYVHFAYDTAANDFIVDPNSCGFAGCGFQSSLSAINSAGTFGFFFTGAPGAYAEYSTGAGGGFASITFETTSGTVPEPAAWGLMIGGFGLIGATMRRRRTALAA